MIDLFSPIPLSAISDSRLSKTDWRVLAALHYKNGPKGCFPSRRLLCEITGLAPQKISSSVTRLTTFGWLYKDGRNFILNKNSHQSGDIKGNQKVTEPVTLKVTEVVTSHQTSDYSKVTEPVTSKVTTSGINSHHFGYPKVTEVVTHIRTNKNNDKNNDKNKEEEARARTTEIIEYLNFKANTNFMLDQESYKLIQARFSGGMTLDDLKLVVDFKTSQWLTDPKMNEFLRPSTLFSPTKFAGYLEAAKRQESRLPVSPTTQRNINNLRGFIDGTK